MGMMSASYWQQGWLPGDQCLLRLLCSVTTLIFFVHQCGVLFGV